MAQRDDDDFYSGFDEYNSAYDIQNITQNQQFQQAVARSSHGRRPPTQQMWREPTSSYGKIPPTTSNRSRMGGRTGMAITNEPIRPMTAVRAAGYTSFANKMQALEEHGGSVSSMEEHGEEKCKVMEQKVLDSLKESVFLTDRKMHKEALDKAKDASRRDRLVNKYREQHNLMETCNIDLTYTVLFNLALVYEGNDMITDALNTYEIISAKKLFPNSSRIKVNVGNIYYRARDYSKALKYYRMAFDKTPSIQRSTRMKILNNIGVTFVRMGDYDDAMSTMEHCVDDSQEHTFALNLMLVAFCVQDVPKMRDAYLKLIDCVPYEIDENEKDRDDDDDVLMNQAINSDAMRKYEKDKKNDIEKSIMTAVKIISPLIAPEYEQGYDWCINALKQSTNSSLAIELEMSKAGDLMKTGDIEGAVEVLKVFNAKDSKTASAAANNLCMLRLLQGGRRLVDAQQYADQALAMDRYNSNALVNAGNIFFLKGEWEKAMDLYRDALNNDASCTQAIFNIGLTAKAKGNYDLALEYFYKLHNILLNNVQVMCQLASIYELLEDTAQAIELYSQANSLVPNDPSILSRLASIYDSEGDKTQAFQCHYDSYRLYPSNMKTIEWMGAYYIENQFSEKAVNYFEKASIMQPHEIKWQLMMASSHRRSGNYQKALELYRTIHRRFPQNIECLKFLVRITSDLGMPESQEYADKLDKAEKVRQLRIQRESDSSQGKRHSANSVHSLPPTRGVNSGSGSSGGHRQFSAHVPLLGDMNSAAPFTVSQIDMKTVDYSYSDPMGPSAPRPKTSGNRKNNNAINDDFGDFDDTLLPD